MVDVDGVGAAPGDRVPVPAGGVAPPAVGAAARGADGALRRARRGWYWYAWASHPFPTTVTTVFMSRYLTSVAEHAAGGRSGRVHVLGLPIAPGALFSYVVSASTVVLVALMPVVGAIADRTGRKRELLLGFGYAGAAACAAMWFVRGGNWQLGAALYAAAFLAYSCAIVVYHSMLCDLAGPDERDGVSSFGWAFSYVGGGLLLAVNFACTFVVHDRALVARLSLLSAGVWWAAFAVVPWVALRGQFGDRRGPDAGAGAGGGGVVRERGGVPPVLVAGFRQLRGTLRRARAVPVTLFFLAAFLVYNDGIQTVITVSALYGDKELHLGESDLLSAILLVQFVAFGGALALARLAARYGAKRVVLGSLVGWMLVVFLAYGMRAGRPGEFFGLGILIAVILGGSQSLSRSMFSHLVPRGEEAEYFGLYEISNSGTSWLGPLLFGLAFQLTGSYRSALSSLVVFFVAGFVLLALVPVRRGVEEAGNVAPARL